MSLGLGFMGLGMTLNFFALIVALHMQMKLNEYEDGAEFLRMHETLGSEPMGGWHAVEIRYTRRGGEKQHRQCVMCFTEPDRGSL